MNASPEMTDWSLNTLLLAEPRRIAMVGTASSGEGAPYDDKRFEIWGVSARAGYVTRANRWFELHCLDGEAPDWAASWRKTMKEFTGDIPEVLMFWPEPDLAPPGVVKRYPHETIAKRFGTYFMSSTFSWMMALAIDEMRPLSPDGYARAYNNGDTIMIRGVDMEAGTEYRSQRSGFRHFIEVAKSLGIDVDRDVAGGLIWEPTPYPFLQDDPHINKLERRGKQVADGITRITGTLETARVQIAQNRAILYEIDAIKQPDYDEAKRRNVLVTEMDAYQKTQRKCMDDLIAYRAVGAEIDWHLDYLSH